MGFTPISRSYSSFTGFGADATFSRNVSVGMSGYAALSSALMRTSSFGCWDLGSASPFRPLFKDVLPWHGLPPPTKMHWIFRLSTIPLSMRALTSSTLGVCTIWSIEASAILTTSRLLSAARM